MTSPYTTTAFRTVDPNSPEVSARSRSLLGSVYAEARLRFHVDDPGSRARCSARKIAEDMVVLEHLVLCLKARLILSLTDEAETVSDHVSLLMQTNALAFAMLAGCVESTSTCSEADAEAILSGKPQTYTVHGGPNLPTQDYEAKSPFLAVEYWRASNPGKLPESVEDGSRSWLILGTCEGCRAIRIEDFGSWSSDDEGHHVCDRCAGEA